MNGTEFKLPNPPIVEAILDVDCDLPPGQKLTELESLARDRYKDRYPKFRTQVFHEHQIEAGSGGEAKLSMRQGVQALQFLSEDERQIVQVRGEGFSFNRLAPYTSLDDYLPEIERVWRLFVGLALPVQIKLIRLRYINRILLPLTDGRVDLDIFLKVGPRLADENNLTLTGFMNQQAAVETGTGHQVSLVLTSQVPEGDKLPIIFDNSAAVVESGNPEDWPWIIEKIKALRALKNHIFKNTLTVPCLQLFQ